MKSSGCRLAPQLRADSAGARRLAKRGLLDGAEAAGAETPVASHTERFGASVAPRYSRVTSPKAWAGFDFKISQKAEEEIPRRHFKAARIGAARAETFPL